VPKPAVANFLTASLVLAGLVLAAPTASAQTTVANLADLVGQSTQTIQAELPKRDYVFIHPDQRGDKVWQYWWSKSQGICARVAHVNWVATSIVMAPPSDCNQYQAPMQTAPQATGSSSSNNAAAAIAGAAVIAGVAVLAHKSHERDEQKYSSQEQIAEYERGYRDGLYHQSYHDYNRSQAYVDGYNAGQQKRDAETSYRSPSGYHSGQASYVQVNDLIGARGSSFEDAIAQRGFVRKGGYQGGGAANSMWWNGSTRQCVAVVVADGRVRSINPIVEGNCL
jgi:hypothetical protein